MNKEHVPNHVDREAREEGLNRKPNESDFRLRQRVEDERRWRRNREDD